MTTDEKINKKLSERVALEEVTQAYVNLPRIGVANLVTAALLVTAVWSVSPASLIFSWITALVLITLARIVLYYFYTQKDKYHWQTKSWRNIFILLLTFSGLVWGATGVIFYPPDSPSHQIFLAFVLGGMVAGSMGTVSGLRGAFYPYCLVVLTPLTIRFYLTGGTVHIALGSLMIVFMVYTLVSSAGIQKLILEALRLRHENEQEIIERLKFENELKIHQEQLEELVKKRTIELSMTNQDLHEEIAQRKRAESALRESEQKYRRIIENLRPDYFFYSYGVDGVFTYVSPAVTDMLGYSIEEFLDHHTKFHTNNPINDEVVRHTGLSIAGEKQPAYEVEMYHKGGEIRRLEVLEVPVFDDQGRVVSIEGVAHDITEKLITEQALQENEERLRLALKAGSLGIYDLDIETGAAIVSPEYVLMLGYDPAEFCESIDGLSSRLHPDDKERSSEIFKAYLAGEIAEYRIEFRQQKKNGDWIWVLSVGEIVERDKDGKPLRMLGTHTEITKLKQAEEELLRAKKLESIGTLAGGIAHDFNNLLTVILGNIELAKMIMPVDNKVQELLADSKKASLRARDIAQKFITFSSGGDPVKRFGSIVPVIEDAVGLALSGSNIEADGAFPDDLWEVKIDREQMGQAVFNVIENARESMPEGGTLNIRAENIEFAAHSRMDNHAIVAGKYVKITFIDHGKGIPEEDLENIFDPYFSTKKRGEQRGMGLGLSSSYSVIKKHDGYIEIKSARNMGTEVSIYLPAAFTQVSKVAEVTKGESPGKKKVLVMDDEELVRNISSNLLEFLGYDVVLAQHGEEALAIYQEAKQSTAPIDIVILDLTIKGGMGGEETMKRLLKFDPEVTAIVASGYSSDPVMSDHANYGFKAAVNKPYTLDNIEDTLNMFS